MTSISEIIRNDLCLGCGLCEAISKSCRMELNSKGFYRPVPLPVDKDEVKKINALCPGIRVVCDWATNTEAWGNVVAVRNAWSADNRIRHDSSSGGVTSSLALYLLESGKVDAVLHAGNEDGNYLHNKLHVSRTRQEILSRNSSRYAPSLMFNNIFDILDKDKNQKFCFIGKPCDVAAVRNILREFPQYKERIPYLLSIFCAGMPSYNATLKAISTFGVKGEPVFLRYRGDGWPGFFTVKYKDGQECKMTYNESWGKILGRDLGFRCKVCPDGIGLIADISSGDSWNSKNGYPDFTESEGKNFCFIRTEVGMTLFNEALEAGYIEAENLEIKEISKIQRYQYERRHIVGWRIAVVQLITGRIFKFKGLGYMKMALKANYLHALKDSLGTCKRLLKLRGGGRNTF